MSRSNRSRSPETVPFAQRVARRWREGVVIANLSVAGYLAQLPRIEDALFGPGMLTTVGVGAGAGLLWTVLRGAFASSKPPRQREREPDVAPPRTASLRPAAAPARPRSVAPDPAARPAPEQPARPSQPPRPERASWQSQPPPPRRAASGHAPPQSGETMAGYPAAVGVPSASHASAPDALRSAAPADLRAHASHANQTGSTLHGYSSAPPALHAPTLRGLQTPQPPPPDPFGPGRTDAFASGDPYDATPSRPSGPPTTRMTALQEAELSASPAASRPEHPSAAPARLSWPPEEVELSQASRSDGRRENSLPPPNVPMATLSRAVPTPPPANDAVVATYIDTVGEPAMTLDFNSSLPPGQRPGASAQIARRAAARVEVIEGEVDPPSEQLDPELVDQLEELRAELLTMSPSQCFVVGISSDGEHLSTKSALAVQLALQLAQSGSRRVLLVEANATRPMLDRALALYVPLAAGFSQQMHRRLTAVSPSWTVLRVAPTLDVLAEGRFRTPGMLYGSVFAVALHELRDHYDVIVADGPVVETNEAAAAFAQVVDGIGYLTSGLPSIRVPRERALARFRDKALFKVLTTR